MWIAWQIDSMTGTTCYTALTRADGENMHTCWKCVSPVTTTPWVVSNKGLRKYDHPF